jgi:hypothetical protein
MPIHILGKRSKYPGHHKANSDIKIPKSYHLSFNKSPIKTPVNNNRKVTLLRTYNLYLKSFKFAMNFPNFIQ